MRSTRLIPATASVALTVFALSVLAHVPQAQQRVIPGPQGTHTENGLAVYAKILCSGVFVSGRAPDDVARGSAYFFVPRAEQDRMQWTIDRHAKLARASIGGIAREARFYGDGAFFWLNRVGTWNLPPETYLAAGAGGQNTWIVPSRDLVIVRMGHMRGQGPARRATNTALGLVMDAIGENAR